LFYAAIVCFVLVSCLAIHRSNENSFSHYRWDFIAPYSGARCLLRGCNPYDTVQLQQQYAAAHGDPAALDARHSWDVLTPVYPPTTFLLIAPFTLLPYPAAQELWFYLGAILFCLALGLLVQLVPRSAQWQRHATAFFALACITLLCENTTLLFRPGNPSVYAIAFSALAVWAFWTERPAWLGMLFLAFALMMKPHLAVAVWCVLLLRRQSRLGALIGGGVALGILCACVLWLQQTVGPAWLADYREAFRAGFLPGGSGSPLGPEAFRFLNLQTVVGLWQPRPSMYDAITWAFTGLVFLFWLGSYLKRRNAPHALLLSLAGLVCLSLLPVYHRDYDSRLLILTLPAMVLLLFRRPGMGCLLVLCSVPLLFCQTTLHMEHLLAALHPARAGAEFGAGLGRGMTVVCLRQQTIALLALAILWPMALLTGGQGSSSGKTVTKAV
jgi:hypothetical protein